jgi:ArsR family transcriptional regulator
VSRPDAREIYELYARVCKALADPKRLLIINELREGPRTVGEVVAALGIAQANASQHLAILRDRGIVIARRTGSNVYYELTSSKIVEAIDLLCEFMTERQLISPQRSRQLRPQVCPSEGNRNVA